MFNKPKLSQRLLCVVDNKKNIKRRIIMVKLNSAFRTKRVVISICSIALICIIAILFFTLPNNNTNITIQKEEKAISENFPNPDRIVYKKKDDDNYYIILKQDKIYEETLKQIDQRITNEEKPVNLKSYFTKTEIDELQRKGDYIVLDYNTISKNYVFLLDDEVFQMIKLNGDGGDLIKKELKIADELKQYLDKKTSKMASYTMDKNKQYISKNTIEKIPDEYKDKLRLYDYSTYQMRLNNKKELEDFMEKFNVELTEKLPETLFEDCTLIAVVAKPLVDSVDYDIGSVTFNFSKTTKKYYTVNLFVVSKVVNSNCIYIKSENTKGWKSGKVTKVDSEYISIEDSDNKTLTNVYVDENTKIINRRTSKEMSISDIKTEDKIQLEKYKAFYENLPILLASTMYVEPKVEANQAREEILYYNNVFDGTIISTDLNTSGIGTIQFEISGYANGDKNSSTHGTINPPIVIPIKVVKATKVTISPRITDKSVLENYKYFITRVIVKDKVTDVNNIDVEAEYIEIIDD